MCNKLTCAGKHGQMISIVFDISDMKTDWGNGHSIVSQELMQAEE